MPIKDLQKRLTQVGVIRLGVQEPLANRPGKTRPAKLSTLRFTSPSKALIDAVAGLYGGEVRAWQANTGPQWEVITGAKEIPVLVPPQHIDPNYELWGNGFRSRLCDGETEQIRNVACLCTDERRECKPTTRMSLMLREIPSLGTWKIESHGWNAAAELPMLAESIAVAPQPIPARLEIQARQKKILRPHLPPDKQIETRNFMVPVLHFDFVTPAQVFGGQIGAAARDALAAAPQQRQALEAAPGQVERTRLTPVEVARRAGMARNVGQVQQLWRDAVAADALNDDVAAVLKARAEELAPTPGGRDEAPAPADEPADDPAVEVVEGEVEPDPDTLWMRIQSLAAGKGWNTAGIEERVYARFKRTTDEIDGWQMREFIAAVEGGEVE